MTPPDTETHDQKESASLEHERLTSLINSMADAVIAVDEHQRVAVYNGAALNILDLNSDLKGKRLRTIVTVVDANNQQVDIEHVVKQAKTQFVSRDLKLKYPNDEMINVYLSIAPVHLGYATQGQRGHVLLMRDITREKSLEEERDEFISVVSHELRTPIAIAEGNISNAQFMVDRLQESIPENVRQSLKTAHDQTIFLSSMINDLATLSRAERGTLAVEIESINAHDLIHDLQQMYTKEAEDKGLKIRVIADPSLQLLRSAPLYVREIMQNFVTNAIKYTEKGHVTIEAIQKKNGVTFEVSDTGIGLSKADQQRVYDKFFRSEDFRTRQRKGTGLGLYVTLKLSRLVHAELDLKSELNKGSTFSVFFPNLD